MLIKNIKHKGLKQLAKTRTRGPNLAFVLESGPTIDEVDVETCIDCKVIAKGEASVRDGSGMDNRLMSTMRTPGETIEMTNNPPHPGELVSDVLAPMRGLERAAQALGVPSAHLCAVTAGRRAISAQSAARLDKALGSTPGARVGMQEEDDLAHGEVSSIEVRRLRV